MKLTSNYIKAAVAAYFRYTKQCAIVCFEAYDWGGGGKADIQILTMGRKIWEVEAKVSLADLKNDIKKPKHQRLPMLDTPVERFYLAIPTIILRKAKPIIAEMYPYAGILSVNGIYDTDVGVIHSPRLLEARQLSLRESIKLVKQQTGTLCRLARDKALYQNELDRRRGEVAELRRTLKIYNITI